MYFMTENFRIGSTAFIIHTAFDNCTLLLTTSSFYLTSVAASDWWLILILQPLYILNQTTRYLEQASGSPPVHLACAPILIQLCRSQERKISFVRSL